MRYLGYVSILCVGKTKKGAKCKGASETGWSTCPQHRAQDPMMQFKVTTYRVEPPAK